MTYPITRQKAYKYQLHGILRKPHIFFSGSEAIFIPCNVAPCKSKQLAKSREKKNLMANKFILNWKLKQ